MFERNVSFLSFEPNVYGFFLKETNRLLNCSLFYLEGAEKNKKHHVYFCCVYRYYENTLQRRAMVAKTAENTINEHMPNPLN